MRIRPICVIAMLTWGLTYGTGSASAQGYPYAPNGYPPAFGAPVGPMPGPYGYPNPGYYAPPPGAMMPGGMPPGTAPGFYTPQQPGMMPQGMVPPGMMPQGMAPPGMMPAFSPGFANYPGSQSRTVPATPAGTSSAGTPATVAAPDGSSTTETLKNLPSPTSQPAAPTAPAQTSPKSGATPSTSSTPPTTTTPGEPLIQYVPNGYLQPFVDSPISEGSLVPPARRPPDHAWINFDYLFAFTRAEKLPAPLVTTGNPFDVRPGAIGMPGTSVVVGDTLNFGMMSGFRLNVGSYVDNHGHFSIEADGMYLLSSSQHFAVQSDGAGNPLIARPIFDAVLGLERAYLDSQPIAPAGAVIVGGSTVDAQTQFYGFEVNGRVYCQLAPRWRADFLFGFRSAYLYEMLNITDTLQPQTAGTLTFLGAVVPAGDLISDFDRFSTSNRFYGLQTGGRIRWDCDWLFLTGYGKIAVGPTVQKVGIQGMSFLGDAMGLQAAQGGILALPSNSGIQRRTVFSVLPEFGATVGINLTPNCQLMAGYSFLLWTNVVRPGGQMQHTVNPAEVPTGIEFGTAGGPAAPTFRFNGELYWIQSINVGINFHF